MNTHLLAQLLQIPGETPIQIQGPLDNTKFTNIGSVINKVVPFIFAAAGVGLLLVIIGAGFTLLTSAGDAKKMDQGKSQLTNGIIGFVIIFVAYWAVQIAGTVLGIDAIKQIFP
jgi:hypothetical protein